MEQAQPSTENSLPTWRGLDVLIISLGAIAALLLGFLALSAALYYLRTGSGQNPSSTLAASLGSAALEVVALIGSVYLLGVRRRGRGWQSVGLRSPSPGWWRAAVAIGVVVIPLSGLIALAIQKILGLPAENPQLPFLVPEGLNVPGALAMLLLGGVIAPFAEELLFRGVLYAWLRGRLGVWPAILISAAIFGVVHGEVSVGVAAGVLGAILAWVYERSRSLWPAVLIHAINNSVKIFILYAMLAAGVNLTGL